MDLQFSREPLTLQERIWLHRYGSNGDPEALLALLMARSVTPVSAQQLLYASGVRLEALVARMSDGIVDAVSGKALIDKHGLQ